MLKCFREFLTKVQYALYAYFYEYITRLRWKLGVKQTPHSLPASLVVSLTSYPPRFKKLHLTLKCLMLQTIRADHIILWVSEEDYAKLPPQVMALMAAGLEIRTTQDLGSYKKIIPALDAFPGAYIATADDDLYYHPSWLQELVEGIDVPKSVPCHRAHEIRFNSQGGYLPYNEWISNTSYRGVAKNLFPTSGGGALYSPHTLDHTKEDRENGLTLCPFADDVWLYFMGRKNSAVYKTIAIKRETINWRHSQKVGLWKHNVLSGGNDGQLDKLAAIYGYPPVVEP